MNCPLCLSAQTSLFIEREYPKGAVKEYLRCPDCLLIFADPRFHLAPEEEKRRYDQHRNSPDDPGYTGFLNRLAVPLAAKLKRGEKGIDFGCGPGPAMDVVLKEKGYFVSNYDPVYFPDRSLLAAEYDFITCTETAEHFRRPRQEFDLMDRVLKRGGKLGLMTEILEDESSFRQWWYPNDPTHICFYQPQTFLWIAGWKGWETERPAKNVVLFIKPVFEQ